MSKLTQAVNTGVGVNVKSPNFYPVIANSAITTSMLASGVLTSMSVPVGTTFKFINATPPAGYLMCDGSVVSQGTYASLFAIVGATYNTGGEGGGNFRLPDMRGRTAISDGTGSGLTARTVGQQVGVETVALAVNAVPSHTHGHSGTTGNISADHTHNPIVQLIVPTYMGANFRTTTLPTPFGGFNDNITYGGISSNHTHTLSGTTDSGTGGSGAHYNVQPSTIVTYIIKY